MSLQTLLTETVTVLRYPDDGTPDRYNNPTRGTATETEYEGRLEQTAAQEVTDDRETLISEWVVYLPPEADIAGHDEVLAGGHTFLVVGTPAPQRAPRGLHHISARLRLIED